MSALAQFSEELEALHGRLSASVVGIESSEGQGSGWALTHDGYVLTNRHVVDGKRGLRVRFPDGGREKADVVGTDAPTDLAVLRVSRSELRALPLATRDEVRVGQVVLAMGDPYWLERSVSLGVVSALERRLPGDGVVLDGLIQTDAAINPGNSGGPLVNMRGQVVGINTAMLPFAQGIGFAVPAWTANWVAALLLQHGALHRRYLGIAARSETFSPELARELGQSRGVKVVEVAAGSPAASAGLLKDDVLLALNGSPVEHLDDLQRLAALAADAEVRVDVWRRGARRQRYLALVEKLTRAA